MLCAGFAGVLVEVGAAGQPVGEHAEHARVAQPEAPDVVAVPPVPLRPRFLGEGPHLVGARRVPRLGDQLHVAQDRILGDPLQQRRVLQQPSGPLAAQDRREVETEPVDVHLDDPVPQAIEDDVADHRMIAFTVLPVPVIVAVVPPIVLLEQVVDRLSKSAERERRPVLVALGRVVEDDVQDDLDAGPVKRLHHLLELERLLAIAARAAVGRLRGHERHRVIAPVVRQPLAGHRIRPDLIALVELRDRHQLDGRHAEVLEIRDLLGQPPVGARSRHARARVDRAPPHVHLVDDGLPPGMARQPIALPVEVPRR